MISVIIPHRNTIDLLRRCVSSIPVSDKIEVLVIDDNSDIEQSEWDDFVENYKHVRLFPTKAGRGAGYARNVGLEHAKGEWIVFSDADDFFYPNAFKVLQDYILGHDVDIAYFVSDSRDSETNEVIPDRLPKIREAIMNKDYNVLRYMSYVPWGKLVKRQLVLDYSIRFEEVEASNDVMFSTLVGHYANKIGVIDDCLYCCTRNKDSLFFGPSLSRIQSRVDAAIRVNTFLSKNGLIKYHFDTTKNTFYFFPKHPVLFFRALVRSRYKGASFSYIKDIIKRIVLILFYN